MSMEILGSAHRHLSHAQTSSHYICMQFINQLHSSVGWLLPTIESSVWSVPWITIVNWQGVRERASSQLTPMRAVRSPREAGTSVSFHQCRRRASSPYGHIGDGAVSAMPLDRAPARGVLYTTPRTSEITNVAPTTLYPLFFSFAMHLFVPWPAA
jgi:hypothetical protein